MHNWHNYSLNFLAMRENAEEQNLYQDNEQKKKIKLLPTGCEIATLPPSQSDDNIWYKMIFII